MNRIPPETRKPERLFFCALACLLLLFPVRASGTWAAVTGAEEDRESGFLVNEFSGTVTVTFLGDCTLGGEDKTRNSALGFFRTIAENGYDYPMRNLRALTAADDLTVANLEGVLTDRVLTKEDKEFCFSGPAAYTEILKSGSIEAVTLANNHSHDCGEAGYEDTKQALEAAGVGWFGTDAAGLWTLESGLKIGFIGVSFSLSGSRYTAYRQQMQTLRDLGCAAVITVMHAGTEYSARPDEYQRQIARRAAACGTDLVIGHHPHVVQGAERVDGVPVVYSLGNCSFGGNTRPRDTDALAVQADLTFEEGALTDVSLRFYPISVTGNSRYNNYSPVFLTGADAERVLRKMEESTGTDPAALCSFAEQ